MTKLRDIGEKEVLRRLQRPAAKDGRIVRVFSEDCAVLDPGGSALQLFTVDALVEGVHFRREFSSGHDIGRKALKVSLSDVIAMGGRPQFYMVSLGAPPDTPLEFVEEINSGMDSVAREISLGFLGGNLSNSPVLFLDITVIGEVARDNILFRNGAAPGNTIFVTGPLGASAEGLLLLKEGFRKGDASPENVQEAIMAHLDPPCLLSVAQMIASWKLVTAMIDLSDGVASDLAEICRESNVGAQVDLTRIPVAESARYWEERHARDPVQLALQGGEDYHLLFTVSDRDSFLQRAANEKLLFFEIGTILKAAEGVVTVDRDGNRRKLEPGYEHYR